MNDRFIYDEETSRLYGPDGQFLKKVFCPKAKTWDQLLSDDPAERSRGCSTCGERVVNLDTADAAGTVALLSSPRSQTCVYASEAAGKVIFLRGATAVPPVEAGMASGAPEPVIRTARGIDDINRGAALGYWPDVRLIEFDTHVIQSKFQLVQHSGSGRIAIRGDYRDGLRDPSEPVDDHCGGRTVSGLWSEAIPFTRYYPDYQGGEPIAAYLIPPGLPDGAEVLVEDPIEDMVGARWNQGNTYRATHVQGRVRHRRVVIEPRDITVRDFMG